MTNAIAGIVYPDIFQVSDLIEPMLNPMKARTTGEKHFFTFKNFQLGCFGNGFASNSKKSIYLALDGWIENSEALQAELGIKAASQEEVLIECFCRFGISFLQKLNGEFAFVLLDQEENHLYLARDPIGKKPLYWYHDKSYFLFASELKGLLATGIVPQTPAPDSIASYLFFGYTPQDGTPIRHVNKLLPAHYLFLNNFHGKQINTYWSYSSYFEKRVNRHKTQIITDLNSLIENAVRARIPDEGPLGCIVSGGLASGTTAYYVDRIAKERDIKAFTASFGDESEEDTESAQLVTSSLHMQQTISEITPRFFLENYATIVWHLDEPLADVNVLATWKLATSASSFTKTTYSGMGSDELLAGHSRYTLAERTSNSKNWLKLLPGSIIHLINRISPKIALNILRVSRTNSWQFDYIRSGGIFDEATIRKAAPLLVDLFDPEIFLHKFYNISRIPSNVSSLLYFDFKTRLPDLYILQYERLMSVNGIKWQTPFLDKRIVEYSAGLPEPHTILESQAASYIKPLIENIFPETFLNRPKKTRKHFLSNWVDDPEIAEIFQLLRQGTLIETGIISGDWLNDQLSSTEQMKYSFEELFAILALEVWFRLFINRSISPSAPTMTLKQLLQEN